MPTLDRAFTLAKMHAISVFVRQYLYFNVPRSFYISLDINGTILECGESLILGRFKVRFQLAFRTYDPHSASAAAGSGLYDHRKADLFGDLHRFICRFDRFGAAGQDRNAGCGHRPPGLDLIAHHRYNFMARPDEFYIAVFADLREDRGF